MNTEEKMPKALGGSSIHGEGAHSPNTILDSWHSSPGWRNLVTPAKPAFQGGRKKTTGPSGSSASGRAKSKRVEEGTHIDLQDCVRFPKKHRESGVAGQVLHGPSSSMPFITSPCL